MSANDIAFFFAIQIDLVLFGLKFGFVWNGLVLFGKC